MESEIFICKQCGNEHEALTQEVASYSCPKISKQKENRKITDKLNFKSLTTTVRIVETRNSFKPKEEK